MGKSIVIVNYLVSLITGDDRCFFNVGSRFRLYEKPGAAPILSFLMPPALRLAGYFAWSFSSTLRILSSIVWSRSILVPSRIVLLIRGAPMRWSVS